MMYATIQLRSSWNISMLARGLCNNTAAKAEHLDAGGNAVRLVGTSKINITPNTDQTPWHH
jgi:hypothetical protein